jgi:hypothetical protein
MGGDEKEPIDNLESLCISVNDMQLTHFAIAQVWKFSSLCVKSILKLRVQRAEIDHE